MDFVLPGYVFLASAELFLGLLAIRFCFSALARKDCGALAVADASRERKQRRVFYAHALAKAYRVKSISALIDSNLLCKYFVETQ